MGKPEKTGLSTLNPLATTICDGRSKFKEITQIREGGELKVFSRRELKQKT